MRGNYNQTGKDGHECAGEGDHSLSKPAGLQSMDPVRECEEQAVLMRLQLLMA